MAYSMVTTKRAFFLNGACVVATSVIARVICIGVWRLNVEWPL